MSLCQKIQNFLLETVKCGYAIPDAFVLADIKARINDFMIERWFHQEIFSWTVRCQEGDAPNHVEIHVTYSESWGGEDITMSLTHPLCDDVTQQYGWPAQPKMSLEINEAEETGGTPMGMTETLRSIRLFVNMIAKDAAGMYPNTSEHRKRYENVISGHLNVLLHDDKIYDYMVTCDETNNPPSIVEQNKLCIDVFVKEKKSDEFFYISEKRNVLAQIAPAPKPTHGGHPDPLAKAVPLPTITGGNAGGLSVGQIIPTIRPGFVVDYDGYSKTSNKMPDMYFDAFDNAGKHVRMHLTPENGIITSDLTKLMMLIIAQISSGQSISVYDYVQAQNLERHFTYKY